MSKVEVNTIEPQCGTTVTVGKCTTTVAVPGNVIKSNAIQASDGGNIVSQSGTDITLGASGDTINLASGASQSGFGRTGTVDWDTSIHTGTVTAATGKGYFVNTTSGGITVNLPAGVVGSIVAVSDYASTAASNNITVAPNGSDKINGTNDDYTISTAGLAVTLVYADATRGWKSVTGSDADATGVNPNFVTATGGTPTTDGDYKVHTFTGPGTFCVSIAGTPSGSNTVDYMVVAGGGGGGAGCGGGGGGGAGGMRYSYPNPATGGFSVSATAYPITVGSGGAGGVGFPSADCGCKGNDSVFSTITSTGGGFGGKGRIGGQAGGPGGSGGGSGRCNGTGGTGNDPPAPVSQGNPGGSAGPSPAGAGGGGHNAAGGAGTPAPAPTNAAGDGGDGTTLCISGSPTAYAGGGGGGTYPVRAPAVGCGGAGGGGKGAPTAPPLADMDGADNTGGGGGGGSENPSYGTPTNDSPGGAGGSGVVIIRYKFQ